jgi:hypothetical protein
MATTSGDERLVEMIREYEKQNQAWAQLTERLGAMGDVQIVVPSQLIASIDDACMVHVPCGSVDFAGIRA